MEISALLFSKNYLHFWCMASSYPKLELASVQEYLEIPNILNSKCSNYKKSGNDRLVIQTT